MTNNTLVPLRYSRSLNLALYLSLIVLWGVGLVVLPQPNTRVAATSLCLLFGLVHTWGYRAATTPGRATAYFGVQTLLVTGLLALSGTSDVWNFLFFPLGVEAMFILPRRRALTWLGLFWLVDSVVAVATKGPAGFVNLLFNAAVYSFIGVFGNALREAELARRQSQQLLEELQTMQRQLQELAVVTERNRLARDLHDSAKQQAFALSAQLDAARSLLRRDPDAAERHVDQAEQLADHLRQELAGLILELRPPELGQAGFAAALRQYAADWSQQTNIAAPVRVTGDRALPPAVEHTLFRIAQEALANVARHSHARQADVVLELAPGQVTLTIQDDGQGFDLAGSKPGIGTQSMRERAATLPAGTLTLDSAVGRGTRVSVQGAT